MTSQQQPGPESVTGARRRAGGDGASGQSTFGGRSEGFGTHSQWRRPDPRVGSAPAPQFSAPQFSAPPFSPAPAQPVRPSSNWPSQSLLSPSSQPTPVRHHPTSQPQFAPAQFAPAHYPPAQYPPAQYPPAQYAPGQFVPQQPYPPAYRGYPQYPPPAPQKRSVVPVVIACVIALVAILGTTALTRGGSNTTPTSTTSTGTYQNDDYTIPAVADQVPRMPAPSKDEADEWLKSNKIYPIEMAKPVRCEATPADATQLSDSEMQAQLNDVLECLLRVWGPALEEAGYTATRPTITVMSTEQQTACGKMRMQNAMFCGSDQNLYFASDLPTLFDPSLATQPWVVESVLAHEYAHAFQGRTGIISARNLLADDASSKEASYLLVRRNEAQADCLAGMFFNATRDALELTDTDEENIIEAFSSIGSDRDGTDRLSTHPKMATRKTWVMKGLDSTSIGACNTYSVPADEVA